MRTTKVLRRSFLALRRRIQTVRHLALSRVALQSYYLISMTGPVSLPLFTNPFIGIGSVNN